MKPAIFPILRTQGRLKIMPLSALAAAMLLLIAGAWWWFAARTQPPPSIFEDPLDDVAWFFSSDDFNALPPEERMRLIAEFVQRFRSLTQLESAALSSFFAGLTGKSREQMRENVRLLARDLMKDSADEYFNTPPEDRPAYLDAWIAKWSRFVDSASGRDAQPLNDQERVTEMRAQSARDRERMREEYSAWKMNQRDGVRMIEFWQREVESTVTPRDQGRIMGFMRDLVDHLGE